MVETKRQALLVGLLLAGLSSVAWAGAPEDEDPLIYGGTPVAACGWPTTVFLGGCTGTLVHPQVVIYAAHCGPGIQSVRFGENGNTPAKSVGTQYCKTNPSYGGGGDGQDHAFCVLSEPVQAPLVPILMGCETAILQQGQAVTIVGFGNADNGPFGIKREVVTTINSVGAEAFIGGGGKDSCQGDSGGPVYVKLGADQNGDDSWRVFGITSYGGACGTGGYYSMMHNGMEWIEGQLAADGIDITPCHDSDGTWHPTPDCFGFPTDPGPGHGTWSEWCEAGPRAGYSSICGAPFNDEPDDAPPAVTITTPESGTMFDTMGAGTMQIPISAEIDDGTGWGVQSAHLMIDGNDIANSDLSKAPWNWSPTFPKGAFAVNVIAIDFAGNEGVSNTVYIGVDEEPPDDPTTDEGDGDGEGTGDGDGDGDGDGEGSGTGPGADGGGEDGGGKGCGCVVHDRGGLGWAALGCLGLLAVRRRR